MITNDEIIEILENEAYFTPKPFSNTETFKAIYLFRKDGHCTIVVFSKCVAFSEGLSKNVRVRFEEEIDIGSLFDDYYNLIFFNVENYSFSDPIKLYVTD